MTPDQRLSRALALRTAQHAEERKNVVSKIPRL